VHSNPQLRGIALMILAVGIFALLDTIAKYLSRWYPVPGIVWARYAGNLVFMLALLAARGELRLVRTSLPGIQTLRGLLLGVATFLYFSSLKVLPIAEAAAIAFVLPLFVVLLAVPMLQERLDPPRTVAVLVGFIGALVIMRPGAAAFTPYALLPIGMALSNALYQILTRKVAGIEPAMTSLFYGALVGTLMFAVALPFAFQAPGSLWHWLLYAAMGALGLAGHLALIRAFECAQATLLAPFVYTQLVWVMLLGLAVFGDFPDRWSLAGMAIIVASGLYLANRQRLVTRK
jgi:drug/metabolite transporter (DMT)-like permease